VVITPTASEFMVQASGATVSSLLLKPMLVAPLLLVVPTGEKNRAVPE
jgi:hypothetical protein